MLLYERINSFIEHLFRRIWRISRCIWKENANILPKHCLYGCLIDFELGKEPPFGPIYNLSQIKIATLHEYKDEKILLKNLFDILSPLLVLQVFLWK